MRSIAIEFRPGLEIDFVIDMAIEIANLNHAEACFIFGDIRLKVIPNTNRAEYLVYFYEQIGCDDLDDVMKAELQVQKEALVLYTQKQIDGFMSILDETLKCEYTYILKWMYDLTILTRRLNVDLPKQQLLEVFDKTEHCKEFKGGLISMPSEIHLISCFLSSIYPDRFKPLNSFISHYEKWLKIHNSQYWREII